MLISGNIIITLGSLYVLEYSGSAFYMEQEHWYGIWWEDKAMIIPKTVPSFSITLDGVYLTPEPVPQLVL